jgi:Cytochrome P460
MAAILGNPMMIDAYLGGIPGNGKPVSDGAKLAKIHWHPKQMDTFPAALVPGTQHDMDFMVKDSKRFADSGGWGWGTFVYDAASDTFRPGNAADSPPQENDAKCGFACHTIVQTRDYLFTDFPTRRCDPLPSDTPRLCRPLPPLRIGIGRRVIGWRRRIIDRWRGVVGRCIQAAQP